MKVLAEEPWDWYLFDDMGQLFLDVLVEHGAISYSVTVELNAKESEHYLRDGAPFLLRMAQAMRRRALAKEWCPPALPSGWAQRSIGAVHEWQKKRNDGRTDTG